MSYTDKCIDVCAMHKDFKSVEMRTSMYVSKFMKFYNGLEKLTQDRLIELLQKYGVELNIATDSTQRFAVFEKMIRSCDRVKQSKIPLENAMVDRKNLYAKKRDMFNYEKIEYKKKMNNIKLRIEDLKKKYNEDVSMEDKNNVAVLSQIDYLMNEYEKDC